MVELLGVVHGKRPGYIRLSPFTVLQRLFGCVAGAGQVGGVYRETGDLTDSPGDILRLVIPSLAQSFGVQGYRDDDIYLVKEPLVAPSQDRLSSQTSTPLRFVAVLHPVDHLLNRMPFLIKEICSCASEMEGFLDDCLAFRQGGLGTVFRFEVLLRAGQPAPTIRADPIQVSLPDLLVADIPAAERACPREEEIKE